MRSWQRRGVLAWLLLPLSLVYFMLVSLRRALYATGALGSSTLPVPVVIVGNLFVGGTGKTPLVIWLVEQLRARGFSPGVISRGYGARVTDTAVVTGSSTAADVGDEPLLIAQRAQVPVVVGRRRVAAATKLLAEFPMVDVIISDDGLQHYALGRQVELELSDTRGYGNGWLLPAGPLREPVSRRCDFRIVNTCTEVPAGRFAMRMYSEHAEQLSDRQQHQPLSAFAGRQRVAAAAGIGHPQRFFDMLASRGIPLARALPLPDHFDFSANPFRSIDAEVILITEKDAVKCARIAALAADPRLWVVPVTARIDGSLADKIVEKLRGYTTA